MKNKFYSLYLLAFFLINDFVAFAQPGDDDGGGGLEGNDVPAAPISNKLVWLGIIALMYAFYCIKRNRRAV